MTIPFLELALIVRNVYIIVIIANTVIHKDFG